MTTVLPRQLSEVCYYSKVIGMNSFGRRLKAAREASHLSQSFVAGYIGMDKTNLSRLENGRSGTPTVETIKKIAEVPGLGVDLPTLLAWRTLDEMPAKAIEFAYQELKSLNDYDIPQNLVEIPVYGPPCAAGFPNVGDQELLEPVIVNIFPRKEPDGLFGIYVKGDSMEPELREGDLLIADRNRKAQHGAIVVACVDGEFTVKLLDVRQDGVFLIPMNDRYEAIEVTGKLLEAWPLFKVERFYQK